jgi:hypothetical protein
MNPYEILLAAVDGLVAGFPGVSIRVYPLLGSCDRGDHLILERDSHDGARTVRIPASSDETQAFYWAHQLAPGDTTAVWQGEGNLFGKLEYVLYFVRRFIFELRDREQIPLPNLDGSVPVLEGKGPSER